jgi:hypothetical protein
LKSLLETAISGGFSALLCVGILGCNEDAIKSRRAAELSGGQQKNSVVVVDEVNRRVAEFNRSLKDDISRAKTNKVESRIESLVQSQAAGEDFSKKKTVTVYGFAQRNGKGDTRSIAELNGRQSLIFASGVDFVITKRQVKFSGKNRVPGVVVSDQLEGDTFCLLKLDAQIDPPLDTIESGPNQKMLQIQAVANTSDLIQAITMTASKAIQDFEAEMEKVHLAGSAIHSSDGPESENHRKLKQVVGGRLFIENIRLLSGKSPPDCEYHLVLGLFIK